MSWINLRGLNLIVISCSDTPSLDSIFKKILNFLQISRVQLLGVSRNAVLMLQRFELPFQMKLCS